MDGCQPPSHWPHDPAGAPVVGPRAAAADALRWQNVQVARTPRSPQANGNTA